MSRLPERPEISWKDDGTPVASRFDDVYYSVVDGLQETNETFLKPCGLPERWEGTNSFVIAELGFGTGLNFLATLSLWKSSPASSTGWLHFLSVEKFLMSSAEARKAYSRWPDLEAKALLDAWPERTKGLQRIEFPEHRVSLSLFVGDAEDWLTSCHFNADAWFLDGFAPAKNDSIWSAQVMAQLAHHAAPGCRVGTYTVAGAVRRALAEAGFEVSKQPGFGRKRERLEAIWPPETSSDVDIDVYLSRPKAINFDKVIVVGAGIAGASVARKFAERGFPVTILDRHQKPASGASGNPKGLVMPRLDAADTPQARLLIQSYLYALRTYEHFAPDAMSRVSTQQYPQSETEVSRFQKLLKDPPLDADWLEANEDGQGLVHHQSGLISPTKIVEDLLNHPLISKTFDANIEHIDEIRQHDDNRALVVLTTGYEAQSLLPDMDVPIVGKMGQIESGRLTPGLSGLFAKANGSYALREDEEIVFGATFEALKDDQSAGVSSEARDHNLRGLEALAPDWHSDLEMSSLESRASVRATTPDRFPIAGVIFETDAASHCLEPLKVGAKLSETPPFNPSVYLLTGLGARGFTFAPLLAELIVASALGEPCPVSEAERELVSPIRFLVRAMRKGRA
ncbi:MAG: bifunctional tRNA (5-methylaminomethyl-2-thiouridine)(34)-methyltransferase MnmD/FAD-dependent 5-carboxymethylaminomethyl-2-thiouridine(34) oxidoreductase MnmC [Ponticaulis sp.]|nr:bifunctional tRNA (5-methylaminomethyl-2-thiouridine)(34)-methyltransferase MnmD/FAD-dependent 5-carboxymethylaminomethyl-2-thiouridine(34) oxidoreductase MnmC [Ponticaulis sp.]